MYTYVVTQLRDRTEIDLDINFWKHQCIYACILFVDIAHKLTTMQGMIYCVSPSSGLKVQCFRPVSENGLKSSSLGA